MAVIQISKRITKEIKDVLKDKESTVELKIIDDNFQHLEGSFDGPEGTPYEDGRFVVDIEIPITYPFKPPKMKFLTMVYHPNISSQTGAICLDILKDNWTPTYTLKTVLISLRSLLTTPEPNDPQDAQVARHYLSDREDFNRTARYWTVTYAPKKSYDGPADEVGLDKNAIATLCEMGFDRVSVLSALRATQNDLEAAIQKLIG